MIHIRDCKTRRMKTNPICVSQHAFEMLLDWCQRHNSAPWNHYARGPNASRRSGSEDEWSVWSLAEVFLKPSKVVLLLGCWGLGTFRVKWCLSCTYVSWGDKRQDRLCRKGALPILSRCELCRVHTCQPSQFALFSFFTSSFTRFFL